LLTGCSLSPSSKLTLFPSGHPLLDEAKQMRDAVTQAPALPRELEKQLLPPYIVEPGDVLYVQMAELDSPVRLPGDQPVLQDGTINLGSFGHYVAAGKSVDIIEQEVRALIRSQSGKDPGFVTARLVTRVSKVYYVLGEVNAPGAFPLAGRETVLDGILAAGGLNDRASRQNIILVRPTHPESCRVVLPVCYKQITQLGDTSTNYQLAPGDRIYVSSRAFADQFCSKKKKNCGPCNNPQAPCLTGGPCAGTPGTFAGMNLMPYGTASQPEGLPAPAAK
jgi:protein involved in polysaccharide export with SLBB domain